LIGDGFSDEIKEQLEYFMSKGFDKDRLL